jgi:C4-dicarboxylate-binding protein DctP
MSNEAKEAAVFDVPGIFDPAKLVEVHRATEPVLQKILSKYGVRYLFQTHEGETIFYVRKGVKVQEVHQPSDLKGLRVRDLGPWVAKAIKTWGGSPVFVPLGELSVAMERGTIDAGYCGWPIIYSFKIYEQAPYITWVGFQNIFCGVLINEKKWQALTPEQQEVLKETGLEAMELNIKLCNEMRDAFKQAVQSVGGKIYYLTPEEKSAFLEAVKPLYDEVVQYSGPMGKELMDALKTVQ